MKRKKRERMTYPETKANRSKIEEAAAASGIDCQVVSVRQAKDQLSTLLELAAMGRRIVVTSDGAPKAMIVRYRPIAQGAPWTSTRALREKSRFEKDSSIWLREEKDLGY